MNGQCCPLNAHLFHLKGKTLSCSGHLNWTVLWPAAEIWHSKGRKLNVNTNYKFVSNINTCIVSSYNAALLVSSHHNISRNPHVSLKFTTNYPNKKCTFSQELLPYKASTLYSEFCCHLRWSYSSYVGSNKCYDVVTSNDITLISNFTKNCL